MSTNGARSKSIVTVLVTAIVAAAAGGAIVWLLQRNTMTALEEDSAARDKTIETLRAKVDGLQRQVDASGPVSPSAEESATPSQPSTPAKPTVVTQFTYITKVEKAGAGLKLTADYAQMLTGDEAAAAATAHGDESPPPNDYYIVNDNPRLRTLMVAPSATASLTTKADGTVDPEGYGVTLAKFASLYTGSDLIAHAPFNLTLTDGVVTAIAEQYLP